jgi:hypothetical protein
VSAVDPTAARQLLARWWCAYDAGRFDELRTLLTDDVHFACRTDTGTTSFEEFVRADSRGRDEVMHWQTEHRLDSPYPLRHHATNFYLTDTNTDPGGGDQGFRHYLVVTQVQAVSPVFVPGGVVEGAVRAEGDGLRIAELIVILDTMDSVPLRQLDLAQ